MGRIPSGGRGRRNWKQGWRVGSASWREEGAPAREGVGSRRSREGRVALQSAVWAAGGWKSAATAACAALAKLELEEDWEDLVVNF